MEPKTVHLATQDPDVAVDAASRRYQTKVPIRYRGAFAEFQYSVVSTTRGEISVDLLQQNLQADAQIPPLDFFMTVSTQTGGVNFSAGTDHWSAVPGSPALFATDRPMNKTWGGLSATLLRLPSTAVQEAAAAWTGADPATFRFTAMHPVSPAMGRYWERLTAHLHRELTAEDGAVSDQLILHRRLVEMVATAALATFPNTAMTAEAGRSAGFASASVARRAMDHIEASAAQPVTEADIAAEVGVDAFTLRRALRQHQDTTAAAGLERARLAGARWELTEESEPPGVGEVARRWGFAEVADFCEKYRARYGVDPIVDQRSTK